MEAINWDAVSAISEALGLIVVVGSLLYVAREVRQNTAMMRVNASQTWTDFSLQLAGPVAMNRELAECWTKGESNFENLDEVDKQRLTMYEWRAIEAWHHAYHLHEQGVLPEPQWRKIVWIMENLGQRQSVRSSWKTFKGAYDQDFKTFLSQYLE